jgi:hypothetical protein
MMTPRPALFLAAVVGLAALNLLAVPRCAAQEPATPFGTIVCSSNFGNLVQLDEKSFHLVAAPPQEIARLQKSKPALTMGPSAGAKFPYDKLEIYLAQEDLAEDDPDESAISVYVRAVRHQKESWFTLAHDRAGVANFDFLTRTKGDTGADNEIDKDNDPGPAVSLALKNNNVPIFELSWWRRETGASTFAAVQNILLLDFRTLRPSVMAVLQCIAADGGGACGVYDNGNAPTTALSCDWDAKKSDFLCTSTVTGDFTPPVSHNFYLGSGADAPYPAKEGDPPTLGALAGWGTYKQLMGKTPDIPGLGPVTVVGDYAPDAARQTAVVFASRGSRSFEPRYFGVVVDGEGQSVAVEILPQPLVDERLSVGAAEVPQPLVDERLSVGAAEVPWAPDTRGFVIPAVINAADKFADDAAPIFQVQPLESFADVSLWQVTAKQGTFHEIVWLAAGFNSGTGRYVFSAVRIASEFANYAQCGSTRTGSFAVSIERKKGTLDATLDVEPAHLYSLDGTRDDGDGQGHATTPCPMKVSIFWNPSVGFVREVATTDCDATTSARNLTITDEGVISTKPDDAPQQ